jgi:hypothetical protein
VFCVFISRNIEGRSCIHCCSGKAITITYSECVIVALGTQHAIRMHHIVICGLARSTITTLPHLQLPYYHIYNYHITTSTITTLPHLQLPHKRHIFRKKTLLDIKCGSFISTTRVVWKNFHSKKNWARYDKNIYSSSCKVPFIIVRF